MRFAPFIPWVRSVLYSPSKHSEAEAVATTLLGVGRQSPRRRPNVVFH